jgi:nitrate/nitrite-specific signal transduction histidine kinase
MKRVKPTIRFDKLTWVTIIAGGLTLLLIAITLWMVAFNRIQYILFVIIPAGFVFIGTMLASFLLYRKRFQFQTIRMRLQVSFIIMAILPAIAISAGVAILGYINGRQRAIDQLESVTELKNNEISSWSVSAFSILKDALADEYASDRISTLLDLALNQKKSEYLNGAIRTRLNLILKQSNIAEELLVVDQTGRIVVSTDTSHEGLSIKDQPFFIMGLGAPYLQIPFLKPDPIWPAGQWVFAAQPVLDQKLEVIGLIAARISPTTLSSILSDRTGIGQTGGLYLVDQSNNSMISEAPSQSGSNSIMESGLVVSTPLVLDYSTRIGKPGLYTNPNGNRVIGNYVEIKEIRALLAVEQEQSEAFYSMNLTLAINLAISLLTIILAFFVSVLFTRSITNPMMNLAETATSIAGGDLSRIARVWRNDELGAVAIAFNAMTNQLREMIAKLEERVADRTQALQRAIANQQRYSLQLEINAKVSREITSILSIDDLLNRVVILIKEAFNYYHVHVSLLENDEIVMRASTGLPQPSMIRISKDLPCLNTRAISTGKTVLANDVSQEPLFMFDSRSPNTRAELVIPLRLGGIVIGTMDIVSEEINVFSQQDIVVLTSLSDQVAIAIENARLYANSRELVAVEERNRIARDLHDSVTQSLSSLNILVEGWRRLVAAGNQYQIETFLDRVARITDQVLKELRMMVHELRPTTLNEGGLLDSLLHRLDLVEKRCGIDARLIAENYNSLPSQVEEELYWIAHEALNNSLKHAGATQVTIFIRKDHENFIFEIVDNGCGFLYDEKIISGGIGLKSMSERAHQINASLLIQTAPGSGTTVRVIVPKQSLEKS